MLEEILKYWDKFWNGLSPRTRKKVEETLEYPDKFWNGLSPRTRKKVEEILKYWDNVLDGLSPNIRMIILAIAFVLMMLFLESGPYEKEELPFGIKGNDEKIFEQLSEQDKSGRIRYPR